MPHPSQARGRALRVPALIWVALLLAACQTASGRTATPIPPTAAPGAAPSASAAPSATVLPATPPPTPTAETGEWAIREYPVRPGTHPHDVAPAQDGGVWFTAQATGELGRLDPATGAADYIPLGLGSAPHGVIAGPDGAAWITDAGQNAIVRVDGTTRAVTVFALPLSAADAGLNTAVFDARGWLWFTGANGFYGRLDPAREQTDVFPAPRGAGPYGITAAADGTVYYASLAGSYVGRIDPAIGIVSELEPPTKRQGARRVWADSRGRVWVSEWNAGQVAVYDPAGGTWREWRLPGEHPQAYAVYVDAEDAVWLSDFGANALVRFDPASEQFTVLPLPGQPANVRQLHGRPGEVWGAESGVDRLIVVRRR